jgi:hypothetical protein
MSRVRWLAIAVMALQACGGEGGRNPWADAAATGVVGDGGADSASGCASVCWRPLARPVNPLEGEAATFMSEECRCPQGFACTGAKTISTPRLTSTHPVCEPLDRRARPLAMAFDFRDQQPTVPVMLRFQLNGGAWPQSAVAGSAGQITITLQQPQAQRVLPLPIEASGLLPVALPPGRHRFQLEMGRGATFDPFKYPITNLAGELIVERAGEVIIDIQAPPVTFELRLNGAPFPAPAAGEAIALRIEGRTRHRLQVKRGPGETLTGGTIWLEPGKYVVTLTTEGTPADFTLPSGSVILTRALEVGTAPLARVFDVGLFALTGAVTIDGKDLPPGLEAEVGLVGPDGEVRATVPAGRPARYRLLAFRGQYDLTFATPEGDRAAGIPGGAVRVLEKKTIEQDLVADVAVTTATWPVEITANGAPVADAALDRGKLQLVGGVAAVFGLAATGPIRLAELVYQGTATQVAVVGSAGGPLPPVAVPVASGLAVSAAAAKLDVRVAPVTLQLRIDGAEPPAAAVPRGYFRFSRVEGPPGDVNVGASASGPLATTVNLTPGLWRAHFQANGDAPGMPAGELPLPDLMVPAEGLTRTLELATVEATIELQKDGAVLPDAAPGKDRGLLQIGPTRVRLPRTGPARAALRIFPGVTSVAVICDETCGAALPQFLTLTPFVAILPPAP